MGQTAAVLTVDITVQDCIKMTIHVAGSPAWLCIETEMRCHFGSLEYDFLAFCFHYLRLVFYSVFFPVSFSCSCHFLRGASSVQQSSAPLKEKRTSKHYCVIFVFCLNSEYFVLYIFVDRIFLGWRV